MKFYILNKILIKLLRILKTCFEVIYTKERRLNTEGVS